MSLGVGLGGFAVGFERGASLGVADKLATRRNQRAIDTINRGAQAEFEQAQASGGAPDYDTFHRTYVIPKLIHQYTQQGNFEKAAALREWADSTAARAGAKLFMQALTANNNGDTEGAAKLLLEAGRVQGYGENNKLVSFAPKDGGGFTLKIANESGKEQTLDFADANEFINWGIGVYAPEKAFESTQAAAAADSASERKITEELTIAEGKAQIDAAKPPSTSDYTAAYKAAAESLPLEADQWPARKRSRWIDREVRRILRLGDGAGAPEPGKPGQGSDKALRFNVNTGEVVEVGEGGKGLGNAVAKGDALAPTQRPTPAPAEPPAPVSAGEPVGLGPDTDLAGTGPDSSATSMAAAPPAATRPEVAGITGGMQAVSAPSAPGLGGPPQPRRPGHVVRMRQLAAQAATLKPGSPEHAAVIGEINRLKQELDAASIAAN